MFTLMTLIFQIYMVITITNDQLIAFDTCFVFINDINYFPAVYLVYIKH